MIVKTMRNVVLLLLFTSLIGVFFDTIEFWYAFGGGVVGSMGYVLCLWHEIKFRNKKNESKS